MQQAVGSVLRQAAQEMPSPPDWVYVNNFSEPHKPIAIELPPGRALEFRDAMRELVDDLKTALPAVFESEDYQTRREAIDQAFQAKQGEAFSALRDKAAEKSIVILRTPVGFALAPARDGQVVPPDEFSKWPEPKRREVQETIEILEKDLEHIMHQIPQWEKAHRDEIRKLNRDTAMFAVGQSIDEVKAKFPDVPRSHRAPGSGSWRPHRQCRDVRHEGRGRGTREPRQAYRRLIRAVRGQCSRQPRGAGQGGADRRRVAPDPRQSHRQYRIRLSTRRARHELSA